VILPPLVFPGQSVSMRDYYINVMCVDKNKNVILINVIGSNVAAPSKVMFAVFFLNISPYFLSLRKMSFSIKLFSTII
jgi:hypothetical protein